MDGLSAASSVAGVAAAGIQLSKYLYDLYTTLRASEREIQDIANNVSLLSIVLDELDGVLCQDEVHYKPKLRNAAQAIVIRCASIFLEIRKHTGADRERKGKKIAEKAAWFFRRERVKPLRASLESLKSTLNILLHVVQLAKTTNNVVEFPGVKPVGHWYVRKERQGLVCLVIDNRHNVEKLRNFEEEESRARSRLITNDDADSFADIFLLPTGSATARQRGESPERKFVVSFHPNVCQSGTENEQHGDFYGHRRDNTPIIDTFPKEGSSSQQDSCERDSPETTTAQLILGFIPHRKADTIIRPAPNIPSSVLLEAKAEETIDTLMREWTHIKPRYFSDDDASSDFSVKPLPSFPLSDSKLPRNGSHLAHDDKICVSSDSDQYEVLRKDKESLPQNVTSQRQSFIEKKYRRAKFDKSLKVGSSPGSSSTRTTTLEADYSNEKLPSSPAPPYGDGQSFQCSSCRFAQQSESKSGKSPSQSKMDGKVELGNTHRVLDAIGLLSEILGQPLFHDQDLGTSGRNVEGHAPRKPVETSTLDTRAPSQEAECHNPGASHNQFPNDELITMKDCLGRKFVFPVSACRTWQDMEALIRRSFSRVESTHSQILKGEYDILSPTGDIILPDVWSAVVRPGWVVELRFSSNVKQEKDQAEELIENVEAPLPISVGSPNMDLPQSKMKSNTKLLRSQPSLRRYSVGAWLTRRHPSSNATT